MSADAGSALTCYRAACPGRLRLNVETGRLACQQCEAALARDELEALVGEGVVGQLAQAVLDTAAGGGGSDG